MEEETTNTITADAKENNNSDEMQDCEIQEENDNAKRLKTENANHNNTVSDTSLDLNEVVPSTSSDNCFPKAKLSKGRNYRSNKDDESSANERQVKSKK